MKIEIHRNTAFCEDLGLVVTGITPEEAINELLRKIREKWPLSKDKIELPYLGPKFEPEWETVKKPKETFKHVDDEFERAQRITYKLNKDITWILVSF